MYIYVYLFLLFKQTNEQADGWGLVDADGNVCFHLRTEHFFVGAPNGLNEQEEKNREEQKKAEGKSNHNKKRNARRGLAWLVWWKQLIFGPNLLCIHV